MNNSAVARAALLLAVLIAGCSNAEPASEPVVTAGWPTDATAPDVSTHATAGPPTSSDPAATTPASTTTMAYMQLDGAQLDVDVYRPAGDGPWPVVVLFHGLSSSMKNAETNTAVAEAAAASGLLVFAPTWIAGDPFPLLIDDIEMLGRAGNCAVAFAQEHAPEFGGDPIRTVTSGFSAGTGPALTAVLDPSPTPVEGCATDRIPAPVVGSVLGDGEYFWQSENFDGAFDADLPGMQAEVAQLVDPARWPSDLDARFALWFAAAATAPRDIGDASDPSGWLARRDPDGSIRADLEQLGQLDDGVISYIDSAQLLAHRLAGAGLDVTLVEEPGTHTTLDKVPALVDAIRTVSAPLPER